MLSKLLSKMQTEKRNHDCIELKDIKIKQSLQKQLTSLKKLQLD